MQNAETVLSVLRERGRRGLPLDELYWAAPAFRSTASERVVNVVGAR